MNDRLSNDLASLRIKRSRGNSDTDWTAQRRPPQAGASTIYKTMSIVLGVGVLALGGFVAQKSLRSAIDTSAVETTEITLVTPAQVSVELSGSGHVAPQTLVRLAPRYAGRIAQVKVREGAVVSKGTVLFVLDAEAKKNAVIAAGSRAMSASARAESARVNLTTLQRRLARDEKLAESGAISRGAVDDLRDQVDSARATYASAAADVKALQIEKKNLEREQADLNVESPIDGRAISKPMSVGDMAAPDKTLVELADFESMAVEVDVSETRLEQVKSGTPCEVILDALASKRFRGEVFEINPRIDRAKATGTVKVKLLDGKDVVLPGMSARVNFLSRPLAPTELADAAKKVIPADAVADRNNQKVAFVVENGHAREVTLVLGAAVGGGFEVKDGPPTGARVVRSPSPKLSNGQAVQEKSAR